MTETLLQKLEDKVVTPLSEMELLRNELKKVKQENVALRSEKLNSIQKLQGLMGLLDTIDGEPESPLLRDLKVVNVSEEEAAVV